MLTIVPFEPRYYKPYSLDALPRKACGFIGVKLISKKDYRGKWQADMMAPDPCQNAPLAHGWCKEHEYVVRLLDLASFVGCPAIELPYQEYEPGQGSVQKKYLLIGSTDAQGKVIERAGLVAFEQVARRIELAKAKKVMAVLTEKARILGLLSPDELVNMKRRQELA